VKNSAPVRSVEADLQPVPVRSKNEFLASLLRILALFSALALLALFLGLALMVGVGHWLVREDALQKANAIAVLSGGFPGRVLEAADLYRQGYAKEIWLTNPGCDSPELKNMGIHFPGEADFNFQVLRRQGVPAKAIRVLDGPVVNTADELGVISGALQKQKQAAVIVVTDKPHTRRVRTLWNHFDPGRGKAIVHGVNADDFDPDGWWKNTVDTHQVIHEMLGMVNVWAGSPMRTRLRGKTSVAEVNSYRPVPLSEAPAQATSPDPVEQE
jgi:uncharacterized SAM-binding protein YcdF (DUF218 family)